MQYLEREEWEGSWKENINFMDFSIFFSYGKQVKLFWAVWDINDIDKNHSEHKMCIHFNISQSLMWSNIQLFQASRNSACMKEEF